MGPTREDYHGDGGRTSGGMAEPAVAGPRAAVLRSWSMRACLPALVLAALFVVPGPARAADPDAYPSDDALRHYVSGRWLAETGDMAGASAELSRAMAVDPANVPIAVEACLVASRAGDAPRALELAHGVLARDPANATALWLEGAALVTLSRPEQALAPLRTAAAIDSANADCWRTLARTADGLEMVELADSCYEHLVGLDDGDAESWFQLATTRARLGRYADADSALGEAMDENPARPGALFLRGWLREKLGHPDEAAGLYEHHLQVHPDDVATRRRLVGLLAETGRVHEALAQARKVREASPRDANAWQVEADLEFRDHEPEAAMRTLAGMRALDPHGADGVGRSVEVLVQHQHAHEAIALADRWAAEHSGDLHALLLRAWARESAGQADSALAYARLAVAARPDSESAHRVLARYLRQSRRWDEAIGEIQLLRGMAPDDPSLLLDLGFCREQSGDVGGAIQAGRDAVAMAPDAAPVLNFLGYMLADHDRDLGEAERLLRRAVDQEPDNGAYLDSMGWLHYRQGAFGQARVELERALVITGGDPVIHEHLGDVYRELKLFDLAKQQYRKSLEGDTGNSRVRDKLQAVH